MLSGFHPAVTSWFEESFGSPTPPQIEGWPAIRQGTHTLIASPTGSGKTLAAFLCAIDDLVRLAVDNKLHDGVQVLYLSPLKALSNDIAKNLKQPLEGITEKLKAAGYENIDIRTAVRTGDTPPNERAKMTKTPPHIFVTTPESLYILLTSEGGRRMLKSVKTVIVDEIHAMVSNKRGSHLALSLERLDELTQRPCTRIGLSATQNPIEEVANFLVGGRRGQPRLARECKIVDVGHKRDIDICIEMPGSPLETVMSAEVWEEVCDNIAKMIEEHTTTLVFVNTRRLAERVAAMLSERLGEDAVTAHHGSLATKHRLKAEQRLKAGELKALVATASLELGIDIGDIDQVCQIASPHRVATFLQRVGRSGHWHGGLPKGRLFPLSRDDLVECAALIDCVHKGELDAIVIPEAPLDILAQQLVATSISDDWSEDDLFDMVRRSWPYRNITRESFLDIVTMLAEGYTTSRGRRGAYLHHDQVNQQIRARRNARLTAITSGGAIPANFDYEVRLDPAGIRIGTLNEDFAIESMAGDIFQLGNTSYKILRVEPGVVRVADAKGQPPSIPFWLGEAPARSDLLSESVDRIRRLVDKHSLTVSDAKKALIDECLLDEVSALQIAEYLVAAKKALTAMPTQDTIVIERFFDEVGGMHVVLHSPFGSRTNRAWGLALRKRFCKSFNVELQAAATEDAIVLSLGPMHSFPLEDVFRFLHTNNARHVLIQALLDAPMFQTRWRWNANRSLAVPRFKGGKKVPPVFQRMQADDLLALCFPDQVACAENIAGDRSVPDHPLVQQTIEDCLHEAMNIDDFNTLLARLQAGELTLIAKDLTEPSPLAQEILNAKPYAFLDDAPLEERRTQAVMSRRWLDPNTAQDLGALDKDAVADVKEQAWPDPRDADELHDALVLHGYLRGCESRDDIWHRWFEALQASGRATLLKQADDELWVATERLPELRAIHPNAIATPTVEIPSRIDREWERGKALVEVVRGRLEAMGPTTCKEIARKLGIQESDAAAALAALESEGFVLQGRFTPGASSQEWCERRLLARIHRQTLQRLRKEIQPVSIATFMRFCFEWQHASPNTRKEGPQGLGAIVDQLQGFSLASGAWESDVLPLRMNGYDPTWLDALCLSGKVAWARRAPAGQTRPSGPIRTSPITLMPRSATDLWCASIEQTQTPSSDAEHVWEHLNTQGASFFTDVVAQTGLLPTRVEMALGELVTLGRITADGFTGLRVLIMPEERRHALQRKRHETYGMESAGRWAVISTVDGSDDDIETIAWVLLRRWGVVFRRLLDREQQVPKWRDLLRVFRRLEARGDVRGGRFIEGPSGEQYALPDAVEALRRVRKNKPTGALVAISAADPLNLCGILLPGKRVPITPKNRILFRDGIPIAVREAGDIHFLEEVGERWPIQQALTKRAVPTQVRAYLGSN